MLRSLATIALTATMVLAGSGAAQAARCSIPDSMRSRSPVVDMIRTTNVGCSVGRDVARGIIRRYAAGMPIAGDLGAPQPAFTVRTRRGPFRCRGRYVELNAEGDLAYELRCTRRSRMVRVRLYS